MVMWGLGRHHQTWSLCFGLITVLGIIVDDAIVVGEAIFPGTTEKARGPVRGPPSMASREVGGPVIAGVVTTMIAFVPLFFHRGIHGQPDNRTAVGGDCLSGDLAGRVACFLLPAHLSHLPGATAHGQASGLGRPVQRLDSPVDPDRPGAVSPSGYTSPCCTWPFTGAMLRWGLGLLLVFTSWGLLESGILKFEYFPDIDWETASRRASSFPNGTPLAVTEKAVEALEEGPESRRRPTPRTASGEPLVQKPISPWRAPGSTA